MFLEFPTITNAYKKHLFLNRSELSTSTPGFLGKLHHILVDVTYEYLYATIKQTYSLFFNQRTTTPQFTPKIELTTLYTFDIG
jgi:hypothetical protein